MSRDSRQMRTDPVVTAAMLIRRPASEVFEAFVDPDITTKFWFTKSSGRLVARCGRPMGLGRCTTRPLGSV